MCVFLCECGLEKKRVERPWSPYVWSGCSSVVQHDGTMTTLSPEHRGRERQGWWNKREKREERAKEANKREGRCARVRTEADTKGKERKEKEGKEMRGEEKEKKEEEKGLHEQPSRKCEAPLPCQPASATSHTHTILLPRWSCSLYHSSPSHPLSLSHTNDHFTHTNISSLFLKDHSDKGSAAARPNRLSVGSQLR